MRTYDRAEEKRLLNQAWDRDALKMYWADYDIYDGDMTPFYDPDPWSPEPSLAEIRTNQLLWLLQRLDIKSVGSIYW